MRTRRPSKDRPKYPQEQSERQRRERRMRIAAPHMLETLRTVEEKLRGSERDADLLRIVQRTLTLAEVKIDFV